MTTFAYSSGNPANLTGGHAASMSDISGPFGDITTFINGANLDTGNLATSAKPVTLLGAYRTIAEAGVSVTNGATSGVYLPNMGASGISGSSLSASTAPLTLSFTAADYAVSGLTTRLRVVAATGTNATAPAVNFTFGLYPVTFAGAANNIAITAGTVVSGSTVTRTAPAASSAFQDASSDFAAPANGVYALGVATSGTAALNCYVAMTLRLEVHHI